MYLEYCEGGDLDTVIDLPTTGRGNGNRGAQFAEEYIWRTFECLARSMMMFETGSETPAHPPGAWRPIVHFDIKAANVLIGDHTPNDVSHQRLPILKIADFGLSLLEPPNLTTNNADWIALTEPRFTPGCGPPEQVYDDHPNRLIGKFSNIWACGALIYQMMMNEDFQTEVLPAGILPGRIMQNTFMTTTTSHGLWSNNNANRPYETFGERLTRPTVPYSNHLVELVHRCLAYNPADRPTANELWGIIDPVLTGQGGYNSLNGPTTKLRNFEPNVLPVGRPRVNGPVVAGTPKPLADIRPLRTMGTVNPQFASFQVPRTNSNPDLRLGTGLFPYAPLQRDLVTWQLLFPRIP